VASQNAVVTLLFKTQYSMSIAQAFLHLALPIHHRYEPMSSTLETLTTPS
jgi:hypothetical protein